METHRQGKKRKPTRRKGGGEGEERKRKKGTFSRSSFRPSWHTPFDLDRQFPSSSNRPIVVSPLSILASVTAVIAVAIGLVIVVVGRPGSGGTDGRSTAIVNEFGDVCKGTDEKEKGRSKERDRETRRQTTNGEECTVSVSERTFSRH